MVVATSPSRATVEQAWQRAGAKCECRRGHHKHPGVRCGLQLEWINRGRHGSGAWEAQRLSAEDGDQLASVQILCWDCHAKDI